MTESVLRSVPCPEDKMPANCRKAIRIAEANGYAWTCTYAIGPEPERIESVLLRVKRPGEVMTSWARWETGKAGSKTEVNMGFFCAYSIRDDRRWPLNVIYSEFIEALGNQASMANVQSS